MEIRKYGKSDEPLLFDLLVDEGDEWSDYHGTAGRDKYQRLLLVAYLVKGGSFMRGENPRRIAGCAAI